jgi:hypothetical protein
VALVGVALLGGPSNDGPPLDPRSDGPLGTSALVSLLEGLGTDVDLSVGLPGGRDDVALVLADRLDARQREAVRAWVSGGGTLVVTDPTSGLVPGVVEAPDLSFDDDLSRGTCTIDALDGVETVDAGAAARLDTTGTVGSCLGGTDAAFVVVSALGAGRVVGIGGADALTNERLGHDDNAVLAAGLLSPRRGMAVRFVDAPIPAGGGDKGLYDLIADGVRRAGLQLGIAFLVYALWRAIRFGRPVPEGQPVEIAGSELVSAAGRLLERGRASDATASVLRHDLRRALRTHFALPPAAPSDAVVAALVERGHVDAADATIAAGDHPVTTDAELVAVARAVASVHQEVLR